MFFRTELAVNCECYWHESNVVFFLSFFKEFSLIG